MSALEFENRRKRFQKVGFLTCLLFVMLLVLAAAYIEIGGAVMAPGVVVQVGENQSVQHPEGGPVAKILVKEGDLVERGAPLILLDGAQTQSDYQLLARRAFATRVRIARLKAMESGAADFRYSAPQVGSIAGAATPPPASSAAGESVAARSDEPSMGGTAKLISAADADYFNSVIQTQKAVFESERARFLQQTRRLETRITGLQSELTQLERQIDTNREQVSLIDQELKDIRLLVQRRLQAKDRETALRRQRVTAQAEIDELLVTRTRTRNALSDAQSELELMPVELRNNIWAEIEQSQSILEDTTAALNAARDRLSRLVIAAPDAGRVHELSIKNVNAVVAPRETILKIVPVGSESELNVRVSPIDIDQVFVGQEVRIRFESFDQRTTPELFGKVVRISADRSTDEQTGEAYYAVRVAWTSEESNRLSDVRVLPGLPASAMFATGERTLMDYLTKPLRQQLFAAFREG